MSRTYQQFTKDINELLDDVSKTMLIRTTALATITEKGYTSDIEKIITDFANGCIEISNLSTDILEDASKSLTLTDKEKKEVIAVVMNTVSNFDIEKRLTSAEFTIFKNVVDKVIKVNYHKEDNPDLEELQILKNGDFIDLRSAENVAMKQGDFKLISLGISAQIPKGYYAEVVPRSSTYKNFGIIMSNSIGIIDESYCGDGDIWMFPAIAMRDTEIHINDRIAQFRLVKKSGIRIEAVDELGNEDRGGIGSTGTNEIKEEDKVEDPKAKFEVVK